MLHLLLNKHFTLHATHSQRNNYKHAVKNSKTAVAEKKTKKIHKSTASNTNNEAHCSGTSQLPSGTQKIYPINE
jgi:hypothetical protein